MGALLRDPEVLVLAAPFAFVGPEIRQRLGQLLRVWQAHGSAYLGSLFRLPEELPISNPTQLDDAKDHRVRRTLVVSDFGKHDKILENSDDFVVDLDQCVDNDGESGLIIDENCETSPGRCFTNL